MAGGMELAYHRRPLMAADDIAALDVVKLGSGVTLYGYYMFHGGTNPDGKTTTLQESQATGYPQDLPREVVRLSGAAGRVRADASLVSRSEKHSPVPAGFRIGPGAAWRPTSLRRCPPESRIAKRRAWPSAPTRKRGFIFLNNYQKDHPLPVQKACTGAIEAGLGNRDRSAPADRHSRRRVYFLAGESAGRRNARSTYATAQPLCRLDDPDTLPLLRLAGNRAGICLPGERR